MAFSPRFTGAPLQLSQDVSNIATYDTNAVPNHVAAVQYLGEPITRSASRSGSTLPPLPRTSPRPVIGNIGRTESWLSGPGLWQFDPSLARIFKLTERFNLEVRAEAENFFNNPHFSGINTGCTTTASSIRGMRPLAATPSARSAPLTVQRVVQFGAFLRF